MTDVTIDRFHARYNGFTADDAAALDAVLLRVVDRWLAPALAGLGLPDAHAVCIPELEVAVDLEPGAVVERSAERWADGLARGIATGLATGPTGPPVAGRAVGRTPAGPAVIGPSGVVWYHREVDVVVDLVTSVAAGDRSRVWAWSQTGLWAGASWPGADDVGRMLARRPAMVPTVLAAFDRPTDLPLAAGGWQAVARAVASAAGVGLAAVGEGGARRPIGDPAGTAGATSTEGGPAPVPGSGTRPGSGWSDGTGYLPMVVGEARRAVPAAVWAASADGDRLALAALALACRAPALVRSRVAREAVVAAAAPAHEGSVGPASGSGIDGSRAEPDRDVDPVPPPMPEAVGEATSVSPVGSRPNDSGDRPDPHPDSGNRRELADGSDDRVEPSSDRPEPDDGRERTRFGGVVFLVHPLRALGLVERLAEGIADGASGADPVSIVARIATAVTGVPIDDPAIATLSGTTLVPAGSDRGEPDPAYDGLVAEAAAEIIGWLRERSIDPDPALDRSLPTGSGWGEPAPLWRRAAVIDRRPGWIEVELPLDSVDTAVRAAGLDLDPGFVWWLGSVVRFRYV